MLNRQTLMLEINDMHYLRYVVSEASGKMLQSQHIRRNVM